MYLRVFAPLAAALALSACGSDLAVKGLPDGSTLGVADAPKEQVRVDYRLHANDIVQIEVYDMQQLNRTVQLDAAGEISMPLIGTVPAVGKTSFELAKVLQDRYSEKYLKNPQISVMVKQAHLDTITVDGAVIQPGVFPINEEMSLLKAIALARGIDQYGNPKEVVVFRMVKNQRVAGLFNLSDIRTGKAADPQIYPNDTIVVAGSTVKRTVRDIVGATPIVALLPALIP